MIVYHGSDRSFKELRIDSRLAVRATSSTEEGYGIYFSLDRETASKYGKYLYTLDVSERIGVVWNNLGARRFVVSLYDEVLEETGRYIGKFMNTERLINHIADGSVFINRLHEYIKYKLSNNPSATKVWSKTTINKVSEQVRRVIRKYVKAYVFTSIVPNTGILKDVSADVVQIVKKERLY
jgi:hypothetical protein